MIRLRETIRALARDYAAEFGLSLRQTIHDAMLGTLACLVLFINAVLIIAALGDAA